VDFGQDLGCAAATWPAESLGCDVDRNGRIDRADISSIDASVGSAAANASDPLDIDGDGSITVLDARNCVVDCTDPNCDPVGGPPPGCGLLGLEPLMAWLAVRVLRHRRRPGGASRREGLGSSHALGGVALVVAALIVAAPDATSAQVTLTIEPSTQNPEIGSPLQVDVYAHGLGDGVEPSIGAFRAEVSFPNSILSFDSASLGADLGTPIVTALVSGTPSGGSVSPRVISLLPVATLETTQGSSVLLGSIFFTGTNAGTGVFSVTSLGLSDELGRPLEAMLPASVPIVVPEPRGALWIGLISLPALVRKRRALARRNAARDLD
jgi:hypothetical protein